MRAPLPLKPLQSGSMHREDRGLLPISNCIVAVPQDRIVAAESFGSFKGLLKPGLQWAGLDCFGMCISLRSISTRVEQLTIKVPTKTRDNTFVQVVVAVQLAVREENAQEAMYKLDNVSEQVDSYVSDVVRTQLPLMDLDEAFENKDRISEAVQEKLVVQMADFGLQIHKALVIDIRVNADVMRSMNEVTRQKRLRDASVMAAEADKIKTVKAAEADADAACLQGEGIARQRGAIIDGLRSSLAESGDGKAISTEDISTLLLTTQYFETLKDLGSRPTAKTYFLPKEADEGDVDAQVRSGMLQGQVGLQFLRGNMGGFPPQHQMHEPSPRTAPSPQTRMPRSRGSSPSPTQPPRPPGSHRLQIQVPPGVPPGGQIQVQAPDGRMLMVQVPPGVQAGQSIQVQV